VDLGQHLTADARLAGGVGEERRVEERDERLRDALGLAIGEAAEDAPEHVRGCDGTLGRQLLALRAGGDDVDQLSREGGTDRDALLLVERAERPLEDARQVKREPIGRLGLMEVRALRVKALAEAAEIGVEGLRDQRLVKPAFPSPHRTTLQPCARAQSRPSAPGRSTTAATQDVVGVRQAHPGHRGGDTCSRDPDTASTHKETTDRTAVRRRRSR